MKIKGSIAFVTGASRGLGLAFAKEALSRGSAKVYAGMRDPTGFNESGIVPVRIDVTDPETVVAAAAVASDVTLLVNNAGIAGRVESPLAADMDSISRQLFETNYFGIIRVTQAFQSRLPDDGSGAILNVLSDATWRPNLILAAYAASKAAAWSYTNHLRLQLLDRKIQVLGLHVGFVDTDLTKRLNVPKSSPAEVVKQTFDALEAGKNEIMADAGTRALKESLSAENPGYITPDLLN